MRGRERRPRKPPKDYRPLVKAAEAAGWKLECGQKHSKLVSPEGIEVGLPNTGGKNFRTFRSIRGRLRDHGDEV